MMNYGDELGYIWEILLTFISMIVCSVLHHQDELGIENITSSVLK